MPAATWLLFTSITLGCATAQWTTESYNALAQFNTSPATTNTTFGTIKPGEYIVHSFNLTLRDNNDPNVIITLEALSESSALNIYCNSGRNTTSLSSLKPSTPWKSELSSRMNQIFISRNDQGYNSFRQENGKMLLTCSVRHRANGGASRAPTKYRLEFKALDFNSSLELNEQRALRSLLSRCCSSIPGRGALCRRWSPKPEGINVTDACRAMGQICTPKGNLYRLDLSEGPISCEWPGDLLTQFAQLSTLKLHQSELTGNLTAVFSTISKMASLQFLDLGDAFHKDNFYANIDGDQTSGLLCKATQGSLKFLDLRGNNIRGTIPDCLFSSRSSIISLSLDGNNLTGSVPDVVQGNSSLQFFSAVANTLTGAIPSSFANASSLVKLDLSGNALTGTIPGDIGKLKYLAEFDGSLNMLSGPILNSFGMSLSLRSFNASDNYLTYMPDAWTNKRYNSSNSTFENVDLSTNSLKSPFPSGLVNAPYLNVLRLSNNRLEGQLPENITISSALRILDVSKNELTGPLKSSFLAKFSPETVVLDLSHNSMNGSLPAFLDRSRAPSWIRYGLKLQGNSELITDCSNSSFNYIRSICPDEGLTGSPLPPSLQPLPAHMLPLAPSPLSPVVAPTLISSLQAPAGAQAVLPPKAAYLLPPPVESPQGALLTSQQEGPSSSSSSSLSTGALAGIVVGGVAGVAVVATLAFFLGQRKKTVDLQSKAADRGTDWAEQEHGLKDAGAARSESAGEATESQSWRWKKGLHLLDSTVSEPIGAAPLAESPKTSTLPMDIDWTAETSSTPTNLGADKMEKAPLQPQASTSERNFPSPRLLVPPQRGFVSAPASWNKQLATPLEPPLDIGSARGAPVSGAVSCKSAVPPHQSSRRAMSVPQQAGREGSDGQALINRPAASKQFTDTRGSPALECAALPWNNSWQIKADEVVISKNNRGEPHKLGTGAYGTVYKGTIDGVIEVAVKIFHDIESNDEQAEILKEVAILKGCRDRHIVNFLGACITEEHVLLVMEYMEGGDLWTALHHQHQYFNWHRRGKHIALQVALGLHYLHRNRIIHFDLKSANVLLTKTRDAKISDVGFASILVNSHISNIRGHSFPWAAPEVLIGRACTEKVDVFSYGVLLWEIITGERPKRGFLRDIRVPEESSSEVEKLMQRCLAYHPGERPSCREIVELLVTLNESTLLPSRDSSP